MVLSRLYFCLNFVVIRILLVDLNVSTDRRRSVILALFIVSLFQKSHRLLPTNLYVILYNFKSRHQDELDLKAGDKVTVIDFSDPDWWKGKCLGRTGYFPSKYCSKLAAGERPLQVM